MEQVQRFCDFDVKAKRGEVRPCGQRLPNDQPTSFTVFGKSYEVDICEEHQEVLRGCLAPFVDKAKKVKPVRNVETNSRGRLVHRRGQAAFTTKDVRVWAQERGIEVAPAGRLPTSLVEDYKASLR